MLSISLMIAARWSSLLITMLDIRSSLVVSSSENERISSTIPLQDNPRVLQSVRVWILLREKISSSLYFQVDHTVWDNLQILQYRRVYHYRSISHSSPYLISHLTSR
jgi:hypothetical protein